MSGLVEAQADARGNLDFAVIVYAHEAPQRVPDVLEPIQGRMQGAFAGTLLVQMLEIPLHRDRLICQDHRTQIHGRMSREYVPVKAGLHQRGEVAAMIQVRVGEDDEVNLRGIEEIDQLVSLERIAARSFIGSAVKQKLLPARFDPVHGPGNGARRAKELYLHRSPLRLATGLPVAPASPQGNGNAAPMAMGMAMRSADISAGALPGAAGEPGSTGRFDRHLLRRRCRPLGAS